MDIIERQIFESHAIPLVKPDQAIILEIPAFPLCITTQQSSFANIDPLVNIMMM